MSDIRINKTEFDSTMQNAIEDMSELMFEDDLYQRYLQYQMMMAESNMYGVNLDMINERMYNLMDDPYDELQRRLDMQEEDDSVDLAVRIDLQRDIALETLFQEYLASNLWDDDYGETLSFSEFIDLKEQEVSQDEINELDETPESAQEQGSDDIKDIKDEVIEKSDKFNDFGFDEDYDEYADNDDEFDIPDDDFEAPEFDIDSEYKAKYEEKYESESEILPDDQDDFPDMNDTISLQKSVSEYDLTNGKPDEGQVQLIPKTQVVPEFVTHEQFETKDVFDEMAQSVSLASGVVEIEKIEKIETEKKTDIPQQQLQEPQIQPAVQEELEESYYPNI